MTKVLVVGATGLVGSNLVKACREEGKEVRAFVRPATLADRKKIDPLQALGANLCEGSIEDFASLCKACEGMDVVISAVGGGQLMQQVDLIKAAKQAAVQRFIPSDYGLDPKFAGKGSCILFDQKAAVHEAVKQSGLNYTFIHSNGFIEYWAYGLGQLGLLSPPEEVQLYGHGTAKVPLVSVYDVAKVTAACADDVRTVNKDLYISTNVLSQEELIQLWEQISGKHVKRTPMSLADIERTMAASNTPDTFLNLIFAQLLRSVWIRGDAMKRAEGALEATELYPAIHFTSVKEALSQFV
jgi:uncharacterized protein YbjT (DUF2867 family)